MPSALLGETEASLPGFPVLCLAHDAASKRTHRARGPPDGSSLLTILFHCGHAGARPATFCATQLINRKELDPMKHLLILPEYTFAGYCSTGGSNKDWAACLAVELDEREISVPPLEETTEVVYLSLHGPHGGSLTVDAPKKLVMQKARTHFQGKCREKEGKNYDPIGFAPYVPAFGRPLELNLTYTGGAEEVPASGPAKPILASGTEEVSLPYKASIVKAVTWEKLQSLLANPAYGVTEKVNGERCLLTFDGTTLTAYNRRGLRLNTPPEGAEVLRALACPFVIDGERMTGDQGGHFVAFDLLEWWNEALTALPYVRRITTLEAAMFQAGLLVRDTSTPTHLQAQANSRHPLLSLLVAATGADLARKVYEEVQEASGEGVVVRRLEADYLESPLKFKFVEEIDVFVLSVNEGVAEGSLKMGLVRSSDQAIIEVGNVRSGLTDANIAEVRAMLGRGERPVFPVTYLPKRTVSTQLVEPRTSMALIRSDKVASECTTDQFGQEKAELIKRAVPRTDIVLPDVGQQQDATNVTPPESETSLNQDSLWSAGQPQEAQNEVLPPPYAYEVALTTHRMLYQDVVVESDRPLPEEEIIAKALKLATGEWELGPIDKNPDVDGVETRRSPDTSRMGGAESVL